MAPVPVRGRVREFVLEALCREDGQDLVEYALLSGFVALASLAAWNLIEQALGIAYTGYDTSQQNLWEPPDP